MFQRIFHVWLAATFLGTLASAQMVEVTIDQRTFQIPAGFVLEKVAGPPLIERPISADFDDRGRLFVTESSGTNDNVQSQLEQKPHRILRLEDTDGDGSYDQRTVFAEDMMFPEGAMWLDGSLYVAAPPEIWKLTDTNDDGVAERREVWFDGKTLTGCANDLHGPYAGPDGYVYWCKGAFAEQTHTLPTGQTLVSKAAHVFRRHPDGGPLEPVMTGGMDNPVEVAFSAGGERFFTTTFFQHPGGGKRDGLVHAIYGGVYGKQHSVIDGHWRTGDLMPVMTHLGAAAPSGLMRIESNAAGNDYQNCLLASLFNMHKVTRHQLIPEGARFASLDSDFVTSDDLDFHPTDVLEDADGSILIVDTGGWYKLCCPTSQLHKPDVLGGIYRIRRSDAAKPIDPWGTQIRWDALTADELILLLRDDRWKVTQRAVRELAVRTDAVKRIQSRVRHEPGHVRNRLAWTLCHIGSNDALHCLVELLADEDSQVRHAAIHGLALHRFKPAVTPLRKLFSSSNGAQNQRAACEALGRIGDASVTEMLLDVAAGTEDLVLYHSALYAVLELGDVVTLLEQLKSRTGRGQAAVLMAVEQLAPNQLTPETVLSELESDSPEVVVAAKWVLSRHSDWSAQTTNMMDEFVRHGKAELVADLITNSRSAEIQKRLPAWLIDDQISDEMKQLVLRSIPWESSPSSDIPLCNALAELFQHNEKLRSDILSFSAASQLVPTGPFVTQLEELSQNDQTDALQRLQAISLVLRTNKELSPTVFPFLLSAIEATQHVAVQDQATHILQTMSLTEVQRLQLATAMRKVGPLQLNRVTALFAKQADLQLGETLLKSLQQNSAVGVLQQGVMTEAFGGFGDSVRRQANLLVPEWNLETQQQKLSELLATLPEGDVRNGLKVFRSQKALCSECHSLGYLGGDIGPDLSHIGKIRSKTDLLESIAFPSASFVRSYEPVNVITVDGKALTGVMKDSDDARVRLVTSDRKEIQIERQQIESIEPSHVSVMPSGLASNLSPQELADLVAFLLSTK
ncbi:MAG: HEAT repeat domain-containing protein [Planctomycetales bacterium]|nr:HEAT repeat domain-containing protein [Planctomycetales bacterium]